METFPEINWSALVKKYLEMKINKLAWKQEMLQSLNKEKEFDETAIEIGNKIKENVIGKLKKKGW